MIWDMLNNINADYRLLTQYRIVFPTVAYFISRYVLISDSNVTLHDFKYLISLDLRL